MNTLRRLFRLLLPVRCPRGWDLSSDGKRFLFVAPPGTLTITIDDESALCRQAKLQLRYPPFIVNQKSSQIAVLLGSIASYLPVRNSSTVRMNRLG